MQVDNVKAVLFTTSDQDEVNEYLSKNHQLSFAEYAQKNGIEVITTTLTISPHKKADVINQIGQEICADLGIKYWDSNFKKQDGYKKSCDLSKEYGFYRQDYCGCVYSMRK